MEEKVVTIRLQLSRTMAERALTLLLVVLAAGDLGSETLTLSTYYPAPLGVYRELITTGAGGAETSLARDNGNVRLAAGTGHVFMAQNAAGGTLTPTYRVGIGYSSTASMTANAKLDVNGQVCGKSATGFRLCMGGDSSGGDVELGTIGGVDAIAFYNQTNNRRANVYAHGITADNYGWAGAPDSNIVSNKGQIYTSQGNMYTAAGKVYSQKNGWIGAGYDNPNTATATGWNESTTGAACTGGTLNTGCTAGYFATWTPGIRTVGRWYSPATTTSTKYAVNTYHVYIRRWHSINGWSAGFWEWPQNVYGLPTINYWCCPP